MKTIVALYDERRTAVRTVRELLAHGIPKDRISFVSPAVDADAGRSHLHLDEDADDVEAEASARSNPVMVGIPDANAPSGQAGVGVGATVGIGSVLLGVAFLSLPAVGPVLAAGPLLTGIAASGAAAGAADLPERLGQSGIPAAAAKRYARAVADGGVLVLVTLGDEHVEDAAIILARHSPIEPTRLHGPAADPTARPSQPPRSTLSSATRPA